MIQTDKISYYLPRKIFSWGTQPFEYSTVEYSVWTFAVTFGTVCLLLKRYGTVCLSLKIPPLEFCWYHFPFSIICITSIHRVVLSAPPWYGWMILRNNLIIYNIEDCRQAYEQLESFRLWYIVVKETFGSGKLSRSCATFKKNLSLWNLLMVSRSILELERNLSQKGFLFQEG